jgi:hypothetical protein
MQSPCGSNFSSYSVINFVHLLLIGTFWRSTIKMIVWLITMLTLVTFTPTTNYMFVTFILYTK